MTIKVIAFDADDTLWINEPYFQETEKKFCSLLEDYLPQHSMAQELFKTEMDNLSLYGYGVKGFILSMVETALRVSNHTIPITVIEKIIAYGKELLAKPIELLDLYGGKEPSPQEILDTPFEKLRGIGLSNAKVNYVKNVAQFEIEQGMDPKKLAAMSNEEVIAYLTPIKGVGRWTVEMLLMFALGREDVFAVDDLGIQNAMIKLYKLDNSDKKKFREEILRLSEKWSPFRTYACLHLWSWKDNAPVK